MPLMFDEVKLDCAYRLDLLIENKWVVEIESVDALNDIHLAKILGIFFFGNVSFH